MACGTPVIAYRAGSVPEVIEDGVTGFIVENEAEAVAVVRRLPSLDRSRIRANSSAASRSSAWPRTICESTVACLVSDVTRLLLTVAAAPAGGGMARPGTKEGP
jgi:hypothetical protein